MFDFVKFPQRDLGAASTQAQFDTLMAAARRAGVRVVGHAPTGLDLDRVIRARWASTEHLYEYVENLVGVHRSWSISYGAPTIKALPLADTAAWVQPGYRLDRAALTHLAAALQQAGVWNCPTLTYEDVGITLVGRMLAAAAPAQRPELDARLRLLRRVREIKLQIVKALQDAGAGLLVGTDMDGFAIHRELAVLVEAGLTPYQALAAATRNVAEFLGTFDSTGTIALGKRADLVLLSGNPLQDIGVTAGPAGVMVGGRWLPRAAIDARMAAWAADTGSTYKTLIARREAIWRH